MASGIHGGGGNVQDLTKPKPKKKSGTTTQSSNAAYKPGGSVYNSQVPSAASKSTANAAAGAGIGAGLGGAGGAQDPMAILAALTGGGGGYPGGGSDSTDYLAQAQAIYDPQTDYLDEIERRARAQAKTSGSALDALYAELARSIGAQAGGIKTNYNTAKTDATGDYKNAYNSVKSSFDASRNGLAATLAGLGIQEAAPSALQKGSDMQALMQGILTANNQAQQNWLTSGRQSMLDYNTANQTGAKLRGGEAREGLTMQLNQFLNELGLKRADLQSQIQEWAAKAQGEAADQDYNRWKDQQGFDLQRAAMAQKAGQWAGDQEYKYAALGAKAGNTAKLDPVGSAVALANRLYNGNSQAANNAVKAVTDSIAELGTTQGGEFNWAQLLNTIERRNAHLNGGRGPGDLGELRQIAAEIYNKMYGS